MDLLVMTLNNVYIHVIIVYMHTLYIANYVLCVCIHYPLKQLSCTGS